MSEERFELESLLKEASMFHGDLCAGITLGTRMSMIGLEEIGIYDPKGKDSKKLIVFVETDRCASDAILAVTGCHPGKRSMKILDYGKMAATFVNLETGKAVRVAVKEREEDKDKEYDPRADQQDRSQEYALAPADDLFDVREVAVYLRPEDMPGKPLSVVRCVSCGEKVLDMREIRRNGKILCRPCAEGGRYYKAKESE